MEVGVHLPQIDFVGAPVNGKRLAMVVDAARDLGVSALCANDHLTFPRPWTDGLTLLAAAAVRARSLDLITSVALPTLRGPHQFAAAMRALDQVAEGRVLAGVGPGSSPADYEIAGVPWGQRWGRFEAALPVLRGELAWGSQPIPLWVASWGSAAGLRRVARHGDGWLASALHASPDGFGEARERLASECSHLGRPDLPHALVTMWTWITESPRDAERMTTDVLAPALERDPGTLRDRVCVGSAESCAQLLSAYAAQGCRRVHFWPLADEADQLSRLVGSVLPNVTGPASLGA